MNNDLISRSELKKAILKHCRSEIEAINHFWYDDTIITLIENAPSVEERPQGEWGKHGECPFCSYIRQWEDDNFCGNCGADMRGDNDGKSSN